MEQQHIEDRVTNLENQVAALTARVGTLETEKNTMVQAQLAIRDAEFMILAEIKAIMPTQQKIDELTAQILENSKRLAAAIK